MSRSRIYLDHASAMPVRLEAIEAMDSARGLWANPGALHAEGAAAKAALDEARASIARELAVKPREVVFTSGLTESDNLAILGTMRALEVRGRDLRETHWVTSAIEHDAVLECFAEIERRGGRVSHVEPDARGLISPEAVALTLRPETELVSIGWANSEIGVVQPLREISRAVREVRDDIVIHADAGQAPLYFHPHVHTLGLDLLSVGSNKLGGPHGIGALYVSNRAELSRMMHGGKQERGFRAGTENIALAAGFAASLAAASRERESSLKATAAVRDALRDAIMRRIPAAVVNSDARSGLPNVLNISIPSVSAEYVVLALDAEGIAVSTKSACREGETPESHVVAALRLEEWRSSHTIRFSVPATMPDADITYVAETLRGIVEDPASHEFPLASSVSGPRATTKA